MSRLQQVLSEQNEQNKKSKKEVPIYSSNGKTIKKAGKQHKGLAIFIIVFSILALIIYVPQFFIRDTQEIKNELVVSTDITMIKQHADYLAKNQSADFDSDGGNGNE